MKKGGQSTSRFERSVRIICFAIILMAVMIGIVLLSTGHSTTLSMAVVFGVILLSSAMLLFETSVNTVDTSTLVATKEEVSLQHDRTLTLVNNLADAILSTDPEGTITVFNAASLNLLDTNASLAGENIAKILQLTTLDGEVFDWEKELKKAKSVVVRDDLLFGDEADQSRLEITYSPIRSSYSHSTKGEEQNGYVIILRDVTKSKSLEEERDEFISVVSHELRTPITIAEGTISNLQLMIDRGIASPEKTNEAVRGAHDQILFLASMVNDLSTLSRAERGIADEAESINVRDLANQIYNEYAQQAEAKHLHFNLDVATSLGNVSASRLYLRELLQNFVTNAIKYTKEGSVTLEITQKSNTITFKVHDTGIGISKVDQVKIFDKFYRAEDYRTRETSGTGLGLYVAVKLSRKLGTKIGLTSRLNHGSTFHFSLPVEKRDT